MAISPTRVLVIDDSVFMRNMLKSALGKDPGFEVLGSANDGQAGLEQIYALKPDVITLDIEMPRLDGLGVLEQLMRKQPTPVVVVSTKTQKGAQTSLEALSRGAIACVAKPVLQKGATLEAFQTEVVHAVRAAAASNRRRLSWRPAGAASAASAAARPKAMNILGRLPSDAIVAIGISAGGPQTLREMLPRFPKIFPPVVITQHMPNGFTAAFAERLMQTCNMSAKEAAEGDLVRGGQILIAPGDQHLTFTGTTGNLRVKLSNGAKVSGFRPSADAMFDSLAGICPQKVVAVVMTGMGFDGAAGLKRLKQAGARTVAQDAETSIVYGMPKAAAETGCVDRIVGVDQIPETIVELLSIPERTPALSRR